MILSIIEDLLWIGWISLSLLSFLFIFGSEVPQLSLVFTEGVINLLILLNRLMRFA
jgi:hypothetical protein